MSTQSWLAELRKKKQESIAQNKSNSPSEGNSNPTPAPAKTTPAKTTETKPASSYGMNKSATAFIQQNRNKKAESIAKNKAASPTAPKTPELDKTKPKNQQNALSEFMGLVEDRDENDIAEDTWKEAGVSNATEYRQHLKDQEAQNRQNRSERIAETADWGRGFGNAFLNERNIQTNPNESEAYNQGVQAFARFDSGLVNSPLLAESALEGTTSSIASTAGTASEVFGKSHNIYSNGTAKISNRGTVTNPDGSISALDYATFTENGKTVLVPTIIKVGDEWKRVDDETAWKHYKDTNEFYGKFKSAEEAEKYGEWLNKTNGEMYGDNTLTKKLYNTADNLQAQSQESLATATQDMGTVGKLLSNTAVAGMQMAGDLMITAATGIPSNVVMATRVFGGSATESRAKGYDLPTTVAIGAGKAAIAYMTEKMHGGNPIYDSTGRLTNSSELGFMTNAMSQIAKKFGADPRVINFIASQQANSVGEAFEEMTEDILDPVIDLAITGEADWPTLEQVLEDGIIGYLVGKGAQVAMGSHSRPDNKAVDAEITAEATAETQANLKPTERTQAEQAEQTSPAETSVQATTDTTETQNALTDNSVALNGNTEVAQQNQLTEAVENQQTEVDEFAAERAEIEEQIAELQEQAKTQKGADLYDTQQEINFLVEQLSELPPPPQNALTDILQEETGAPTVEEQTATEVESNLPQNTEQTTVPAEPIVAPENTAEMKESQTQTIPAMDEQFGVPQEAREATKYQPVSQEQSMATAVEYLSTKSAPVVMEETDPAIGSAGYQAIRDAGERTGLGNKMAELANAPVWQNWQQDASSQIMNVLAEDARKTGNWDAYKAWRKVDTANGSAAVAQSLQARAKRHSVLDYIIDFCADRHIDAKHEAVALDKAYDYASRLDAINERANADPTADVRQDYIDIIMDICKDRRTGGFFSSTVGKLINGGKNSKGMPTEYLAKVAEAQCKALAKDYTPTSFGDKLKSWQSIAQLLKLSTTERNILGNTSYGFIDTLALDLIGVPLDLAMSKGTGARTTAFNTRWMNSTARQAAIDAINRSVLEISLDIDMNSVGNKYDANTRAFSMSGNVFERALSRASQLLSYSLQTTDQMTRGLVEGETVEKLMELGLDEETARAIAEERASHELFTEDSFLAKGAQNVHDWANVIGFGGKRVGGKMGADGKMHGGKRQGGFGLGDLTLTYAKVPTNLAIKPLQLSPLAYFSATANLINTIKLAAEAKGLTSQMSLSPADAARLKQIQSQMAVNQSKAVSGFARGSVGVPLSYVFMLLAKAGLVKKGDDDDDYNVTNMNAVENRKKTQLNVSATLRALTGGTTEWQADDKLVAMSWLEPINAFMDIGYRFYELSEDEDAGIADYAKGYLFGTWEAMMEMPLMDKLNSFMNTVKYTTEENMGERVAGGLLDFAENSLIGLLPGQASQIANAFDPYTRDTRADTRGEEFLNKLANKTGIGRKNLDIKQDSLGNDVKADNALLNALNSIALPGAIYEYAPNETVQLLNSVYDATGKSNFFPDYKAPKEITFKNEDIALDTEQSKQYEETFKSTYNDVMEQLTKDKTFKNLDGTVQAKVLAEIDSYAKAYAKNEFLTGQGKKDVIDSVFANAKASGNPAQYLSAYIQMNEAKKENDYSSIDDIVDWASGQSRQVRDQLGLTTYYDAAQEGMSASEVGFIRDNITWKAGGEFTSEDYARMDDAVRAYQELDADKQEIVGHNLNYINALIKADKYGGVNAETYFKFRQMFSDYDYELGDYDDIKTGDKYFIVGTRSADMEEEDRNNLMRGFIGAMYSGKDPQTAIDKFDNLLDAGFTANSYGYIKRAESTVTSRSKKNLINAYIEAGFTEANAKKIYDILY